MRYAAATAAVMHAVIPTTSLDRFRRWLDSQPVFAAVYGHFFTMYVSVAE